MERRQADHTPWRHLPLVGREGLLEQVLEAVRGEHAGALLAGELGMGKTWLADAAADVLESDGWTVARAMAAPAMGDIPFGAVSHLLPRLPAGDLLQMMEALRLGLLDRAEGAPMVLVADDAHHLDRPSLALVHRLVVTSGIAVLLTVRTGAPLDETLTALWKDGHVVRFDVPPLGRTAHDELVRLALGGPAAPALLEELWSRTRGNPLFLRELVRSARESGAVTRLRERFVAQRPIGASQRMAELVGARLSRLAPVQREALDVVAVGERLPLDVLHRLADRAAVVELERRDLVRTADGQAVLAQPLYGEIIRDLLPDHRRAVVERRLARALTAQGVVSGHDSLRAATWLLAAGEQPGADLAGAAAREALARGDAGLAERLSRTALADREDAAGFEALVVLGTALSSQHRSVEAGALLERAEAAAEGPAQRARAALARAHHLVWMERDVAGGAAVLRQAAEEVDDPEQEAGLRAELAFSAAVGGDAQDTIRIADGVVDDPAASELAVLTALVPATLARCVLGRFEQLDEQLDRAERLARRWGADRPLAADQLGVNRVMYRHYVDVGEAVGLADRRHAEAIRAGRATGLWSATAGWVRIDAGRAAEAVALLRAAQSRLAQFDPFHMTELVKGMLAVALAMTRDAATGRAVVAESASPDLLEPRSRLWHDRTAAWLAAADGDLEGAAALALDGGRRAVAGSLITWGASTVYDAVRFGRPVAAAPLLEELAGRSSAPLLAAYAAAARAAAEDDPDALEDAARALVRLGAWLPAGEALAAIASRPDDVDGVHSGRLAVTATHLVQACGTPPAPGTAELTSPLTEREGEIAREAATGRTTPEIARRLYLSPRTVDNHLAAVYRKLGLSGRQQLRPLFPLTNRTEQSAVPI